MKSQTPSQGTQGSAVAAHQPLTAKTDLLSSADLKILKAPFPRERLGVKIQTLSKEKTRAMLVLYLQHTDVQDRIEEVDPAWTCEVLKEERHAETVFVRSRMIIKGVARENVGEGYDPKAAYSDALKRCAMLFGIGRYLYDSPTVWTDYQESRDRYRQWSIDDYEAALGASGKLRGARTSTSSASPRSSAPASSKEEHTRPREELNRILMNLYRPYLNQFPQTQFSQLLQSRYHVGETRLMTVEQLEDLIRFMEAKLESVA